ncbi:MAG: glucose-1-phosphate thymidylyltransferase RfbA [Oscillospiraceae bacterium]|nr:glucose-1-phosphate thymidylyltransferase RfbA [Oscillospiraceae bacterium]
MKGIILAGGAGTRLYPLTLVTSKQLLPVYNKPMIYYPLSTLMLARIREVLVISTPEDTPRIQTLLGDGSQFGMKLEYAVQEEPRGLAEAFTIGRAFIGDEPCAMILGDNIFYGNGLGARLAAAKETAENGLATVFGYYVEDPERFGVMEVEKISDEDRNVRILSIEEKPKDPKSNYAVVGLYFYPAGVSEKADLVKPGARGELEITSLNEIYLREGKLTGQLFGRGYTWMDAGTVDSLRRATNFVCMIEQYQGMSISAPEEIAYLYEWIDKARLAESVKKYGNSPYGKRLKAVLEDKVII